MGIKARCFWLILVGGGPLAFACSDASGPGAGTGAGGVAGAVSGGGNGTGGTTGEGAVAGHGGTADAAGAGASGAAAGAGGSVTGAAGASAAGGPGSGGSSMGGGSGAGGASSGLDAGVQGGARTDAGRDATPDARPAEMPGGEAGPAVDPTRKIKVWLAGDSTMQPCTTACPCGWGSQLQPLLNSNATVVNSGAGGRSIQTWLYDPNVTTTLVNGECEINPKTTSDRWQAMLDPTTGMKPGDYLFIEFGINDGDSTCNRHVGTALFQTYLGVMAKAAKDRGAQPVFLTSTSALGCTGSTSSPNRGFGPQTKAAGLANDVPVIDLTQLSAALYSSLGFCPSDLDFTSTITPVGKFFCDDHTHFEAAGAAQIAGVVARALRAQNVGLAAYLK